MSSYTSGLPAPLPLRALDGAAVTRYLMNDAATEAAKLKDARATDEPEREEQRAEEHVPRLDAWA